MSQHPSLPFFLQDRTETFWRPDPMPLHVRDWPILNKPLGFDLRLFSSDGHLHDDIRLGPMDACALLMSQVDLRSGREMRVLLLSPSSPLEVIHF